MDRRVAATALVTLTGLVAATLWVPAVPAIGRYTWSERTSREAVITKEYERRREVGLPELPPLEGVAPPSYWAWNVPAWPDLHYRPVWSLDESDSPEAQLERAFRAFDARRDGLPLPLQDPRDDRASIQGPMLLVELGVIFAVGTILLLLRRRTQTPDGHPGPLSDSPIP